MKTLGLRDHVWTLEAGSAELFLLRGESQRPLGLVDAPGCLPGTGTDDLKIVAKFSDDAVVEAVSFEALAADQATLSVYRMDTQVLAGMFSRRALELPQVDSVESLREHQREFTRALSEAFDELDRGEVARQQTRTTDTQVARQRAADELAGVLMGRAADGATNTGDPLMVAMSAVGRAVGIEIEAHPLVNSFPSLPLRVQAIARASRCRARVVTLAGEWWRAENGPLLAFAEDGRPVALIGTVGGYRVEDPSGELSGRVTREVAGKLAPRAFALYRPFPDEVITWKRIAAFALRDNVPDIGLILCLGALVGLLSLVTPFVTQLIFDYAIPGGLDEQMWALGAAMLVAALGTASFSLAQGFLTLRIETKADRDVQSAVIDRILRLPAPFFRLYSVGDLASRTMSVDAIRQIISGIGITTLLGAISSLFNFFILFRYGWQLGALAIGLGVTALVVTVSVNLYALRYARQTEDLEGAINGLVNQLIAGMAKLRVTGASAQAFAVWAGKFAEKTRLRLRMRRIQNLLAVFNGAFPAVSTLLIFWFAFQRITTGEGGFSTGDFLAYNAAFGAFLGAALAFSGATIQAIMVIPLYERARPILHELPESSAAQAWPGELTGDIDLRHVSFRYNEDGPLVLDDLNLTIRPGEFVAVVGPSGSGKSTLLRLLLGFEQPAAGSIFFNGQALDTLDRTEVRRQIGVVLQTSQPISGDIYSNIAATSGASMEQAWAAVELAGLTADIRALPMGMHTVVSEEGGGLSGGQRQRLMIARAVVGDPRILFFDEATSALDNETQAHVAAGLENLKATRLVIAHRLSTVEQADRIIVLRGGRIEEQGTHAQLIERRGLYHAMASRQEA